MDRVRESSSVPFGSPNHPLPQTAGASGASAPHSSPSPRGYRASSFGHRRRERGAAMGAWGVQPWDNDGAADWFAKFFADLDIKALRAAFKYYDAWDEIR